MSKVSHGLKMFRAASAASADLAVFTFEKGGCVARIMIITAAPTIIMLPVFFGICELADEMMETAFDIADGHVYGM